MLLLEWADQDLVHHPIIDEQHRGLVATINTLQYFIDEEWPLSSLGPTIEALGHHVNFHFKTEETILLKCGISEKDMELIKEYRSQFLKELRERVASAIFTGETQELTDFLVDWWVGHKSEFHDKLTKYFDPDVTAKVIKI